MSSGTPDSARWAAVTACFDEALQQPADQRLAWLRTRCAGDAWLLAEVTGLLAAWDREAGRFGRPARSALGIESGNGPDALAPGDRVGPYEVVREVGRGGMGRVLEAVRADADYRKRVAIKVMAAWGPAVLERFRAERRILAGLEHPHIAALLDGGVTASGIPYFAMEYVEGEPIDAWCARHAPPIATRVQLLRQVCAAVQYAHQHLIIHRDLKPGNILVTAEGTAKLLDFGVAKLVTPDETEPDLSQVAGTSFTPAWASPEQLQGLAVTTACDVHALGLVLYLVLTGRHPFREPGLAPAELRRRLLDVAPPSTGLGADLDAILGQALEKDPLRRYASAGHLAEDLGRWLDGVPVTARAPSLRDRTAKFVRRHRAAVAAASLTTIALLGGLVSTTWQARRADAERHRAEEFVRFVEGMLASPDPAQRGRDARIIDILGLTAERSRVELAADPGTRAAIQRTLGMTYTRLGVYDSAEVLLTSALADAERTFGPRHVETARAAHALGLLHSLAGRHAEADSLFDRSLSVVRRLGPEAGTVRVEALVSSGGNLFNAGRLDDAAVRLEEGLAEARRLAGAPPAWTARALNFLGLVAEHRGDRATAKARYREAITAYDSSGSAAAADRLAPLANLSNVLKLEDSLAAAATLQSEALAIARERLGPGHPAVAAVLTGRADISRRMGRPREAEGDLRDALAIQERVLSADHLDLAPALSLLGLLLCEERRPREGEPYLQRALDIRRAQLPAGHWFIHNLESAMVVCLAARGAVAEADSLGRLALQGLRDRLGPDHPRVREAAARLEALPRR